LKRTFLGTSLLKPKGYSMKPFYYAAIVILDYGIGRCNGIKWDIYVYIHLYTFIQ
jgi:hypothetical protein